jgi:hypothetical protein
VKVIAKPVGMVYHFLNQGMMSAGELVKATDFLPQSLTISRADQVINRYPPPVGYRRPPQTATIPIMTKFFLE